MAAGALTDPGMFGDPGNGPRRRKQSPVTFGRVLVVVGIGLVLLLAYTLIGRQTVSDRPNETKTTRVILPPPPPPPPPEVKPVEKPPEPKPMPLDQPVTDTPPPPTPDAQPTVGDSALTAREGAGPSNYGLAVGDGGGTRIGGRPGGSGLGGFNRAAYASYLEGEMRRAFEGSSKLRTAALKTRARVWINPAGLITRVEITGSGVASDRAEAIRAALVGRTVRQPDASLAMPVALSLDFRRSG